MESAAVGAILNVLFDRMAPREFTNFFRGRKHEERLLKKLKHKLRAVRPLLNDAEEKQWTNRTIKDWVDELKDVILHADDLLDEIATKAMQSKLDSEFPSSSSTKRKLRDMNRSFVGTDLRELIPRSFVGVPDMESRIEEIVERLEDFLNEKDSLGLRDVVVASHRLSPTTSLVEHASVFGRNNDKDKIIQLLISDAGPQIGVIPIVGMGGIGKTTLAQLVYNDPKVDRHFELKVWVCVSEVFDIRRVTISILDELKLPSSSNNLNTLQVELRNCLAEKKFLIVLDDVWNEKYENWDQLSRPFAVGERGSKIIVTARNKGVASIMQTVPIFHLEQLSNEDCWLLFSKHAFVNVSHNVQSSLEPIGRKIVEKCKGLPLALKALGGLLRYKVEVEEWENVLESHIWDLPDDKSDILPALLLSYHHLPSHLKLCFAYCAIIPKDYEFEKDELVPLWIAEGFVQQPRTNGRIEDIGDDYFRELISRSLFQQATGDKFLMHDLINDVAQFVVGDYCCRLEDDNRHDISEVRYFSYFNDHWFNAFAKLKAINVANCLRTFKSLTHPYSHVSDLNKNVLHDVLPTLKCLRVLSLSHYTIYELPDSIGSLIHLRYLNLCSTCIRCLPETISSLCNLETLLLRNCMFLTRLPTYLCKLIRLRHLDLSGTNLRKMPMQIGRLKSLQRLTTFVVGNQIGSTISELRELHLLRGTLSISNLQNVLNVRDAFEANLKKKKHLEKLQLEWAANHTDDSQKAREILDNLQPHINLEHLTIENYGGTRFPGWLGYRSLLNLKSLCLRGCTYCTELPPLGQLPSLQELTIARMNMVKTVGSEFYEDNSSGIKSFQSLKKLTFEEMPEWVEWSILGAGEFCHLLELCINECPKLIGGVPKHLPYLKKLEISGCQFLVIEKILKPDDDGEMVTDSTARDVPVQQHLPSLQVLEIKNISESQILPLELCGLTNLEVLKILGLESRLDGLQNLTSLKSLQIRDCPNFVSFADGGGLPAPNLTSIHIWSCKKLKALPEQMCTLLPSLQELRLYNLPEIESFPLGGLPNSLSTLSISRCHKLMARRTEWGLQRLPSLRECFMTGDRMEEEDKLLLESFPEECLLPTSLNQLCIYDLPNLKSLNPNGLRHLNSLKGLFIENCPNLQSLPDEGLPSSLLRLEIKNCPLLKVRCQIEKGEDWLQISHIPYILFDAEFIQLDGEPLVHI